MLNWLSRLRRARRVVKLSFGTTNLESMWNRSQSVAAGVVFDSLYDDQGALTNIGFTWTDPPSGTATNSGPLLTAAEGCPFPSNILRNLVQDSGAVKKIIGVFTGLDTSRRYNLYVMGARAGTTLKPCKVIVESAVLDPAYDAGGNVSSFGTFSLIKPAADGTITVTVELSAGNTTAVYLNGIILEEA